VYAEPLHVAVKTSSVEAASLNRASNVTGLLVDAALDSAQRHLWTALRLENAANRLLIL
jgi:hypothetical protein